MTATIIQNRGVTSRHLSSRIYVPWHPIGRRQRLDQSPSALMVAQHGRFGNMVRQVSQALAVAEILHISHVLVQSIPNFPVGSQILANGVTLTHGSLSSWGGKELPETILGGDFFVKNRLPVNVADVDFERIGNSLAQFMGLTIADSIPSDNLVIHFRSGDAFAERPHSAMGQPPLSFYEKIIEYENPRKVTMVFEDRANPVIGKVQSLVETRGIPFSICSGNFGDDLTTLLAARTLVTGQGTLAEAIVLLSPGLQRWISFGENPHLKIKGRALDSTVGVFDPSGCYSSKILSGNWKNSPEQRQLMMEYPAESLEIRELGPSPRKRRP